MLKKFKDKKGKIRSGKLKYRQHNSQMKEDKKTNNDPRNKFSLPDP